MLLPAIVLVCASGPARAADPALDKSAATVTATPPAHAPVKPLTPKQSQQRQLKCEQRARENHIGAARHKTYIDDCLRLITSASNY